MEKPTITTEEIEKNVKEAMKFGFELGEALDKAYEDGSLGISDIGLLVAPLMHVGPVMEGVEQLKLIGRLSHEQRMALVDWAQKDFDISNDKLEEKIEAVFEMFVRIYGVVELFKKK